MQSEKSQGSQQQKRGEESVRARYKRKGDRRRRRVKSTSPEMVSARRKKDLRNPKKRA